MNRAEKGRGRGDLEIVSETVLVAIPRGDEELRVVSIQARTSQGKEVFFHSVRVHWRDSAGVWRPGKAGVTIRAGELKGVAEALVKAAASGIRRDPGSPPTARAPEPRNDSDLDALFGATS